MLEPKRRVQIFIPEDTYEWWKEMADALAVPLSHWVITCVRDATNISPTIQLLTHKMNILLEERGRQ